SLRVLHACNAAFAGLTAILVVVRVLPMFMLVVEGHALVVCAVLFAMRRVPVARRFYVSELAFDASYSLIVPLVALGRNVRGAATRPLPRSEPLPSPATSVLTSL